MCSIQQATCLVRGLSDGQPPPISDSDGGLHSVRNMPYTAVSNQPPATPRHDDRSVPSWVNPTDERTQRIATLSTRVLASMR